MGLNYLQNELLPKREAELRDGKNLATRQPIYVVLDLRDQYVSGHSDYSIMINYKGKPSEFGYVDNALDTEYQEFALTAEGMETPEPVTRFWSDQIISFFLTSGGAHDYLEYQKHNLTDGYVYVFYSGYANREMDALLCNS